MAAKRRKRRKKIEILLLCLLRVLRLICLHSDPRNAEGPIRKWDYHEQRDKGDNDDDWRPAADGVAWHGSIDFDRLLLSSPFCGNPTL
jgi:hypothetical protein